MARPVPPWSRAKAVPRVTLRATAEDQRIAALATLAIAIHWVEATLPSPLPGVKPGLANIVTLIALQQLGWRAAAWVSALRVLVGSIASGGFLSPTFALSAAGALGALVALGLARRIPGIGCIGLSVLAALAHSATQFALAYVWLVPHPGLWRLLPVLMASGLLFGLVSGRIADMLLRPKESGDGKTL